MTTPDKTRGLIPSGVDRASRSKGPRTSEASEDESLDEVHIEGANWSVRGKLARLGGDLKGNLFKAVVELIDHDKLQMKRDVLANGMAEEMLFFQICVSFLITHFLLLLMTFVNLTLFLIAGLCQIIIVVQLFPKSLRCTRGSDELEKEAH